MDEKQKEYQKKRQRADKLRKIKLILAYATVINDMGYGYINFKPEDKEGVKNDEDYSFCKKNQNK